MIQFFIIPSMLVFALFIVLGVVTHFKQKGGKWIYYTLAFIAFLTAIALYIYPSLNPADKPPENKDTQGTTNPATPPKNSQGDESPGKEKPPIQVPPPSDDKEKPDPPPETPSKTPEKITVPDNGSVTYKVVKGDTLWSIFNRSGITIDKIKQWNHLQTDTIIIGQNLILFGKNTEPVIEPAPQPEPPKQDVPTSPSLLISHGNLQKKEIALTFDAGSDAAGIRILDILKKYNLKATFFLTGKWVEMFPEYAKRIASEGHDIGNHTYSHPDAVKTTSAAFTNDMIKSEEMIKSVTGRSPRPFFRFPYGSYNALALKTVGQAGYPMSIQWSLDTIDWQQPSANVIVSRIEQGASNGDIILMHIGGIHTPEAVDRIIPILQAKGYKLVTLSELLK